MVTRASSKWVKKITLFLPRLSANAPQRKQLAIPPIIKAILRIPSSKELNLRSHCAAGNTYEESPFWKPMHIIDMALTAKIS